MRWIDHNGLGCPVSFATIVETQDPTGERHIGPAGCAMNVCEHGNSWVWESEIPESYEIVRYRVMQPNFSAQELFADLERQLEIVD